MFVVIDKARLSRLIALTRDDRRPRDQGRDGPFYRIQAANDALRLSGRHVEATVPATIHEPGVLFLRVTLFRQMLRMLPEKGFVAIQANTEGIMFGDVRLSPEAVDMLLYSDPARAPEKHPAERDDGPEQIHRAPESLF